MLQIDHLQVSYNHVPALHDISLRVDKGEIVALVGGNGNGKSTTLRAIAGLNRIDGGSIALEGTEISTEAAHARVRRGISLVPEGRRLFPRLTVARNLELGAYIERESARMEEIRAEMYALFPVLAERRAQLAGTMSGGEQQMLAIARGLMARPRLLLLDEPSWGIAPRLVSKILDTIVAVNATGVTMLLVEQNVKRALGIAHRAYVIQTGRVALAGPASELLDSDLVRRAYLGM